MSRRTVRASSMLLPRASGGARVLPEGRGQVSAQGLDFYDRLVDGMLERGIKPALTLYHWELPVPLADLGGWRNRDIANWFADYTDVVARRLGDRLYGDGGKHHG